MKYFTAALLAAGLGFLPAPGLLAQVSPPESSPSSPDSGSASRLKKDVLTLIRANVGDPVIISYIRKNTSPGERMSGQDLIDLKQAGASEAVLTALVEAPAASGQPAPSGSSGSSSAVVSPDNSTTTLYSSSPAYYPYSYYDGGSYWPYYPYYPYAYPYWGFGVTVPFFFHSHDGHFHHDDHFNHFHSGHFAGVGPYRGGHVGTVAPHGGFVSHGGGGHGGGHR